MIVKRKVEWLQVSGVWTRTSVMAPMWSPLNGDLYSTSEHASITTKNASTDMKNGHAGMNGLVGKNGYIGKNGFVKNGFVKNGTNGYITGNGYVAANGRTKSRINVLMIPGKSLLEYQKAFYGTERLSLPWSDKHFVNGAQVALVQKGILMLVRKFPGGESVRGSSGYLKC